MMIRLAEPVEFLIPGLQRNQFDVASTRAVALRRVNSTRYVYQGSNLCQANRPKPLSDAALTCFKVGTGKGNGMGVSKSQSIR